MNHNNQQNPTFYDQLAMEESIPRDQFTQELKEIRNGIEKDMRL